MKAALEFAAGAMHGELQGEDRVFDGVSIDTRTMKAGELFVALKGPNFDGADYVAEAARRGAAGAVVETAVDVPIGQIVVPDARRALGALGAAWRRRQSAVVIGITGSNGKTTLKEMAAACLSTAGSTLATEGNLNNDLGVPLMLSRIEPVHRYAVIEMGANRGGEIAYLASLAEPDVVAITNAGDAHLEGFGSVEGIARGKGEILGSDDWTRPGVAVLNADDAWFDYWVSRAGNSEIVSFGIDAEATVRARSLRAGVTGTRFVLEMPSGSVDVDLALPGVHNVRNACAAAAIASALGVAPEDVQGALERVRPVAGRLEPLPGVAGMTLFDDSYNANPKSVIAAAEFLAALDGESVMVLGDMGELGENGAALHSEVGESLREAGIDVLYATGFLSRNVVEAFGRGGDWFESIDDLIDALRAAGRPGMNVLVKGSRFMRMERVIAALTEVDTAVSEA